ncbi:FAD-dependent monooxygenase [Marinobacterium arenosum]|uniref:FAD-dependent monooxygenase n=1 Tax=Marinobacterium arenosum TaxID=2862496 RepID=UPI001C96754E|nr:FAD-dependent monooxygenase [Marinobacterium arenosum]MBY4678412.1 FAD-dependent monooxygenase [Marinobacterium arenosum]
MHTPDSSPRASLYYDYKIHPFKPAPEQRGEQTRHPVAVVGAGPIGLALALDLARYGVASVVLEADVQVSEGSRAIVFTRRSMEILQQVGVAERMMEDALPWRSGNSIYRGQRVFRMEAPYDPDDRYQPMHNLQQQYLEQYLVEQCEQQSLIELRWGTRFVELLRNDDQVELLLDTPEGEYSLQADWLVACDGARSPVRSQLGLRMDGASYTGNFVIADIKIDIDLPTERLAFFDPDWNPGNTVLMHREPHGIWRLDYQLPAGETPEQALQPESLYGRIQAQLDMVGIDAPWQLDWCSVYSARAMTLPDYRHNRVLFAGDAAHMLPIFGVRGANTGLQDSQNLAWKLAARIQGWGGDVLLNSYSHERVGAAREIIEEAGKSTRFMTPPSNGYRLLRDATLSLSLSQPFVGPLFHWRTSRAHDYLDSPLNSGDKADNGPLTGAPLQNIRLAESDYLFDHLGGAFYLMLFAERPLDEPGLQLLQQRLQQEGVPFEIVQICRDLEQNDWPLLADPDGRIAAKYGAADGSALLARPDQHLCARWSQLDLDRVEKAIRIALGKSN